MRSLGRSLAFSMVGMVVLGILLTQPSRLSVPLDDHCVVATDDTEPVRLDRVYRFDPKATPVGPDPVLDGEPVPTPESYQYYAVPISEGAAPQAGSPTPCLIKWPTMSPGVLYPTPGTVTPSSAEIFHVGSSGVPQLEAEVAYTPVDTSSWDDYEAIVDDAEWVSAPGFAWYGLRDLMQHWQAAAALILLLGIIRLAWPDVESGEDVEQ